MAECARGGRVGSDEQVRGGLPRQALLRRLRGRGRDRGARANAREGAVRRGARERAAACGRAGEHGRLLRRPLTRRPGARAVARPRRPPDARAEGQLLREALRVPPLRRLARDDDGRLRRRARTREGGAAEADRLRRLRLPADGRGRSIPRDRRRGRRAPAVRHGALLGARRRRPSPQPGAAQPFRHLDDTQDARRPAGGVRPLHRGVRAEGRPRQLPGHAGRSAHAHDRREGDVFQDRRHRSVPRLPATDPGERRHPGVRPARRRPRRAHRRHRHASRPARPACHGMDRAGSAGAARGVQADRESQHRAVRRAAADGRIGGAPRDAGGDDARFRRGRLRRGRLDHRRRAPGRCRRRRSAQPGRDALREAAAVPGFRGYTSYA